MATNFWNPMRFFLPLLLLLCAATAVQAQNATLRGFVRDASDGQTLQGVNVILRSPDGSVNGAATDRDGYYAISRIAPGTYTLLVSYIGYETLEEEVAFRAGVNETRNFDLRFAAVEAGEVVVEAEGEGAASMGVAGLQTVQASDLERIPTPGLSADLVSYIQSMPGVVSTGDRGGQLFVRGGTPTQNLVLIDGIPIYQPFHVIGFYSAFPADVLSTTDIYAGGFGAKYGGRISSVIDISTRSGNNRSFEGSVSAGPFLTAARLEGPLVPGKASFLFSDRESVIEPVAPELLGRDLPYRFYDRFGKLSAELSSRTSFSVTAMQTYDRGNLSDLAVEDPNQTVASSDDQVVWRNEAYGARMLHLPESAPIIGEVLLTYTRVENEFGTKGAPERVSGVQSINGNFGLTYAVGDQEVQAGAQVRNVKLNYGLGNFFQNISDDEEYLTEASFYLDAAFPVTSAFIIRPGVRGTSFRGKLTAEPRVRLLIRPGGTETTQQITAAWGLYRQDLEGIADRRDAGDVFTAWVASDLGDSVPQAMHAILGYQYRPSAGFEFEVEGYYKALSNLLIPEFTSVPTFTTSLQPADGEVFGLDVRVEGTKGPFYGYVSYGYSQVEYTAKQAALEIWYGQDELTYNPPHDRRHQVNAVSQIEALGFDFNVKWQMGSGLPFSRSAGFDGFVLLDSLVDVTTTPDTPRVLYGRPYDGRLPFYHRLDVSLSRAFSLGSHVGLTLQGGVINAYDRRNLFFLDLFTLRRIDQLPVIPSFGLKLDFR